ncbi:MAG: creatininase family protein [Phycisphaeraceae bacterium]|nr:creatininase family protein [Phycisphaeraceae bacterium]
MTYRARPYVLHEASYRQLLDFKPNVAVLPWGATEAHNYHLPYGTDVIEATAISEAGVAKANALGAKCILLPTIPFGNDNLQLDQVSTITMRSRTQYAVLFDVADSLVKQGIDRLVVMNFHGGNDFKQMIRDVVLDLPIFIVQVNGYQTAPYEHLLDDTGGDHANEFETSIMLHLKPEWVSIETAGDGSATPFKLKSFNTTQGVWAPRDWRALTKDTGTGDPRKSTAEKGKKVFEQLVNGLVPVLTELSAAKNGDFPYVVRKKG